MVIMANNYVNVATKAHWLSRPEGLCKQGHLQQSLNWSKYCNAEIKSIGVREVGSIMVSQGMVISFLKHSKPPEN
jgi:hypothetical protein